MRASLLVAIKVKHWPLLSWKWPCQSVCRPLTLSPLVACALVYPTGWLFVIVAPRSCAEVALNWKDTQKQVAGETAEINMTFSARLWIVCRRGTLLCLSPWIYMLQIHTTHIFWHKSKFNHQQLFLFVNCSDCHRFKSGNARNGMYSEEWNKRVSGISFVGMRKWFSVLQLKF